MSRRTERVSVVLREELSNLLREALHDPRLSQLVTITHVDLTADLQRATVRVTVLGGPEQQREAMSGLEAAAGFLRKELGARLRLKRTPELRFAVDASIAEGDHVLALLDSLKDQERTDHG